MPTLPILFLKNISKATWQRVILQALRRLNSSLKQFVITTHAEGDNFSILFGLRPAREEGDADWTDPDYWADREFTGRISLKYWHHNRDLLDHERQERERECGKLCKAAQELDDELYGPKGRYAFQWEWPVLNICGERTNRSHGVFLRRISKKDLECRVQEVLLEEAFVMGFLTKAEDGQFLTLDGVGIVLR
jgi:hypothetical protein